MKIILNQNIDNLGKEGDIVNVKDGYARNYLIPKGWAKNATKNNIESTKNEIEAKQKREAKTRDNLESLAKLLDKLSLKLSKASDACCMTSCGRMLGPAEKLCFFIYSYWFFNSYDLLFNSF